MIGRACGALHRAFLCHGPDARHQGVDVHYGHRTTLAKIAVALAEVEMSGGDLLRLADFLAAPDGPTAVWVRSLSEILRQFAEGAPLLTEVLGGLAMIEAAWWRGARTVPVAMTAAR